jgi:hypothetical protein
MDNFYRLTSLEIDPYIYGYMLICNVSRAEECKGYDQFSIHVERSEFWVTLSHSQLLTSNYAASTKITGEYLHAGDRLFPKRMQKVPTNHNESSAFNTVPSN